MSIDTNIQIPIMGVPSVFNIDFGVYFEDQKQFFIKMFTLHNGLHDKMGLYVFHIFIGFEFGIYRFFIVPNLKSIHAVFAIL